MSELFSADDVNKRSQDSNCKTSHYTHQGGILCGFSDAQEYDDYYKRKKHVSSLQKQRKEFWKLVLWKTL